MHYLLIWESLAGQTGEFDGLPLAMLLLIGCGYIRQLHHVGKIDDKKDPQFSEWKSRVEAVIVRKRITIAK